MFDDPHQNHFEDFARPFAAAIIGGYIGSRLDRTRFGYWFNTNPVVGMFCYWLKLAVCFAVAAFILLFIYYYLSTPEIG